MSLQLNEKEARCLGFAFQAHNFTTCKDGTRPILSAVLLTETDYGFTLTSTDSHILFHTSHQLEQPPALDGADISGPSSLLLAVEEKHGFRDIGKALAKATGPVTFGPTYRGTEQKFNFDGGGVYVSPLSECAGEFPKWASLFPTESVEVDSNRGLNLNPKLVRVMGKLGEFAIKAGKIWETDPVMYCEPATTNKKPVAFVLNVEPRPVLNSAVGSWHGLVMPISPTKYGLNDPSSALLPEAVRNV